jgi:hypothetical protein
MMNFFNKIIEQIKKIINYIVGVLYIMLKKDGNSTLIIGIIVVSFVLVQIFVFRIHSMTNKMKKMEEEIKKMKEELKKKEEEKYTPSYLVFPQIKLR